MTDIIVIGNIIYENLRKRNLSVKWLVNQLNMMGIKDIKDIYYATVDENNEICIDNIDDKLQTAADITEHKDI